MSHGEHWLGRYVICPQYGIGVNGCDSFCRGCGRSRSVSQPIPSLDSPG